MVLSARAVNDLTDEIMAFLIECGGPYDKVIGGVQENIILALATGQYVLGTEHGKINYFASYWKVGPEDLEHVRQMKRPDNITEGPIMYVSECGSKGNIDELKPREQEKLQYCEVISGSHRKYPLFRCITKQSFAYSGWPLPGIQESP